MSIYLVCAVLNVLASLICLDAGRIIFSAIYTIVAIVWIIAFFISIKNTGDKYGKK